MKELSNCPRCGTLFVKMLQPFCQSCYKKQERDYESVCRFMRRKQNRMATLNEVCEYTGVSVEQIQQFIREGRIIVTHYPNLGYPCDSCGQLIRTGRICLSCKDTIQQGLAQEAKEKRFNEKREHHEISSSEAFSNVPFFG